MRLSATKGAVCNTGSPLPTTTHPVRKLPGEGTPLPSVNFNIFAQIHSSLSCCQNDDVAQQKDDRLLDALSVAWQRTFLTKLRLCRTCGPERNSPASFSCKSLRKVAVGSSSVTDDAFPVSRKSVHCACATSTWRSRAVMRPCGALRNIRTKRRPDDTPSAASSTRDTARGTPAASAPSTAYTTPPPSRPRRRRTGARHSCRPDPPCSGRKVRARSRRTTRARCPEQRRPGRLRTSHARSRPTRTNHGSTRIARAAVLTNVRFAACPYSKTRLCRPSST